MTDNTFPNFEIHLSIPSKVPQNIIFLPIPLISRELPDLCFHQHFFFFFQSISIANLLNFSNSNLNLQPNDQWTFVTFIPLTAHTCNRNVIPRKIIKRKNTNKKKKLYLKSGSFNLGMTTRAILHLNLEGSTCHVLLPSYISSIYPGIPSEK